AAPQIKVAVRPNSIAITMASTEPSTLAAAFIAQAHSTACDSAALDSGLHNARRPVGKGMPMANPSGTSTAPLTTSFTKKATPTRAFKSTGRTLAYTRSAVTIAARAIQTLRGDANHFREAKLPAPLESSIRKTTTVKA